MAVVSSLETVSYNGFTFPTESIITIDAQFVQDQAQRTVVYTKYTISVNALIADDDRFVGVSNERMTLPTIRRRLSIQGQNLTISNTGFGDLSVNTRDAAGTVNKPDVKWGPCPRVLKWKPMGVHAAEITWVCEVHIIECPDDDDYYWEEDDPSLTTPPGVTPVPPGEVGSPGDLPPGAGGGPTIGGDPTLGGTITLETGDLDTNTGIDGGPLDRFGRDRNEGGMHRTRNYPALNRGGGEGGVAGFADGAGGGVAGAGGGAAAGDGGLPGGIRNLTRLLAYNFTVNVGVDEQGYTTRTVSGYLEIPMTRVDGGREMPDTADVYWNSNTNPKTPHGFRRASEQTSLSEDKRRLNFSVTDVELPQEILPPFVLECRASHTATTNNKALMVYQSTLRASYTLRKDVPKSYAIKLFLLLLAYKLARQAAAGARAFIPLSFTAEDPDIYGRSGANFSFTYQYLLARNATGQRGRLFGALRSFRTASGLWSGGYSPNIGQLLAAEAAAGGGLINPATLNRIRDALYTQWEQSMRIEMGSRGHERLYQTSADDLIVDLCSPFGPVFAGRKRFIINSPFSEDRIELPVPQGWEAIRRYDLSLSVFTTPGEVQTKKLNGVEEVDIQPPRPKTLEKGSILTGVIVGGIAGGIPGAIAGGFVNAFAGGGDKQETAGAIFGTKPGAGPLVDNQGRSKVVSVARLSFDIIQVGEPPRIPVLTGIAGLQANQIIPYKTRATNAQEIADHGNGIKTWRVFGSSDYLLRDVVTDLPEFPPNFFIDDTPIEQRPGAKPGSVGFSL